MKAMHMPVVLSLATCLAYLPLAQPCYSQNPARDEPAVHALVAGFDRAMNANDAAALSLVFHEDADFTNVVGMTAHGRKAIEDFHRPLFEGDGMAGMPSFKNAEFRTGETRIRFIRPDVASVDVTWTQTGSTLNGIDRGLREGLLSWIVTKEGDTWAVAVMHNMDLLPVARPSTP